MHLSAPIRRRLYARGFCRMWGKVKTSGGSNTRVLKAWEDGEKSPLGPGWPDFAASQSNTDPLRRRLEASVPICPKPPTARPVPGGGIRAKQWVAVMLGGV
ncbi:hypothetical protein LIA77_01698 [Sarocladium implicatum]|nr:hypothetical protein LIA77_01698 [Sarocladium implicatum]